MSTTIVQALPQETWRRFVEEHPASNIFHTPEMFQVFQQTRGYRAMLWAAVDDHQRPLALLLPVEITLSGGLMRRFTSRAVAYGSVLCAPNPEGAQALRHLLGAYKRQVKRNMLFTEFRNLSDLGALQPALSDCGFAYEDHLNFLVDLTRGPDEIWKLMRSNARRNVRRARKAQVSIQDVHDREGVAEAYSLLRQIYHRIQVPLADISFFHASFDLLVPKNMMRLLLAQVDGVNVGVLTLLLHKDTIIYWYAGTLREHTSARAGDLLVWHTLEWGSENGYRLLDFGGAGKPDEEYGVRDFKAKFGGELVNYGRNTHIHAPLTYRASRAIYQVARQFLYGT